MKKRILKACFLTALLALSSCVPNKNGSSSSGESKKLIVYCCSRDLTEITLNQQINHYLENNELDISVKLIRPAGNWSDTLSIIKNQISVGDEDSCLLIGAPDYLVYELENVFSKLKQERIVDMSSLIDQSSFNGFNANLLNNFTLNNKLLAVPISWGTNAVVLNNQMMIDAFGNQYETIKNNFASFTTMLSNVNTSCVEWDQSHEHVSPGQFGFLISRYRIMESIYEFFLENNVSFPTVNNESGLNYIKELLTELINIIGHNTQIFESDLDSFQRGSFEAFSSEWASALYFSLYYYPSVFLNSVLSATSDKYDFILSTYGEKLIGFENGICYFQSPSLSRKKDKIDQLVKTFCEAIINDDDLLGELAAKCNNGSSGAHNPWLPVKNQLLQENSYYFTHLNELFDNQSNCFYELLSQIIDRHAIEHVTFIKDADYKRKVDVFANGLLVAIKGDSIDKVASDILSKII